MDRVRLAVIGVGHLGKEHARILAGQPGVELVGVADARAEQAEAVARRCRTRPFTDHLALLDHGPVDGAVVAVPTVHHRDVARDCLQRGVSLLVEKPLAATLEEADELVDLARRHGVLLQVGHVERFNPVFEELSRRPVRPKFITAQRLSPFSGRSLDIGVVLDLMIHDIDMLLALVRAPVREVSALGLSLLGGHEDLARATLTFADGCVAHLSASRVNTGPVRQMELWAPEGLARADFHRRRLELVQPSERLRHAQALRRPPGEADLVLLRTELFGRYLQKCEIDCNREGPDQLTREIQEFVGALRTGSPVRVPGEQGRDALAVACRVLDGLRAHAWDGCHAGPSSLPPPLGPLFGTPEPGAAA